MRYFIILLLKFCHFFILGECLNSLNIDNNFFYTPVNTYDLLAPYGAVMPNATCLSAGCKSHKNIIENNNSSDCLNGFICKDCKETHIKNQSICFYSSLEGYESLYEALLEDYSNTSYDNFEIPVLENKPHIEEKKEQTLNHDTPTKNIENSSRIQNKTQKTNQKGNEDKEEEEGEEGEEEEGEEEEEEEEEEENKNKNIRKQKTKVKKHSTEDSFLEKKRKIHEQKGRHQKLNSVPYIINIDQHNNEYNKMSSKNPKKYISFLEEKPEKEKKIYRTLKMSINKYEEFLKNKLNECEVNPDGISNIYIKLILQIVKNEDEVYNDPSRKSIFNRSNGVGFVPTHQKRKNDLEDEESEVDLEERHGESEEEEEEEEGEGDEENFEYGKNNSNKNTHTGISYSSKIHSEKTYPTNFDYGKENTVDNNYVKQSLNPINSGSNNTENIITEKKEAPYSTLYPANSDYYNNFRFNQSSDERLNAYSNNRDNYYVNGSSAYSSYAANPLTNFNSANMSNSAYGYIQLRNSEKKDIKKNTNVKEQHHAFLQVQKNYENEDSMEEYYKSKPGFIKSIFQKAFGKKKKSENGDGDDMDEEDSGTSKKKKFFSKKKKEKKQKTSHDGFDDEDEHGYGGGGGGEEDDEDGDEEHSMMGNKKPSQTKSTNKSKRKGIIKKIRSKIKNKLAPDKQTLHIEAFFNSILVKSCKDSLKWKGNMFKKNSLVEMTLKVPVQMKYIENKPLHFLRSGYEIVISCQNCSQVFFNSCIQVYCPRNANSIKQDPSQLNGNPAMPIEHSNIPLNYMMDYSPWSSYFMYNDYFNKTETKSIRASLLILIVGFILVIM